MDKLVPRNFEQTFDLRLQVQIWFFQISTSFQNRRKYSRVFVLNRTTAISCIESRPTEFVICVGKRNVRSIEEQISYFPFEATKTRVHQLFNRIKSHARVSNSIQIRFPRNLSISFSKRNQLGHSPRPKRNLAIATNVDHLVVFLESTRSTKTQIHSSAADNNPLERTSSPRSDNFFRFPIWNRNGKKRRERFISVDTLESVIHGRSLNITAAAATPNGRTDRGTECVEWGTRADKGRHFAVSLSSVVIGAVDTNFTGN